MDKRFEKTLGILMIMALVGLIVINICEGNLYGLFNGGKQNTEDVSGSPTKVSEDSSVDSSGSYISSSGLINEYPGILRFHVVANSNSAEDQSLKLKVRDYVLERIQNALAKEIALSTDTEFDVAYGDDFGNNYSNSSGNSSNASDDLELALAQNKFINEYVTCKLPLIEQWADEAVKLYGYDYDTTAGIGIRHIPAKYYEELFFPEGNYEALTISIGEGAGENWWCVVFPPLCLIESAAQESTEIEGADSHDSVESVYSSEGSKVSHSENTKESNKDNSAKNSDILYQNQDRVLILKSKTLELLEASKSKNSSNYSVSSDSCKNSISKSIDCLF